MPESAGGEQKKVLVRAAPEPRVRVAVPDVAAAWRWVGWIGAALAAAGLVDLALAWYPPGFGRPEWEFATVAQVFSGLPLVAIGLVSVLGAALALGRKWLLIGIGAVLALGALAILVSLGLFVTVVPLALQSVEGMASAGIKKLIIKTLWLGLVFGAGFAGAAVAAFRQVRLKTGGADA
jgi:hypothetical protein